MINTYEQRSKALGLGLPVQNNATPRGEMTGELVGYNPSRTKFNVMLENGQIDTWEPSQTAPVAPITSKTPEDLDSATKKVAIPEKMLQELVNLAKIGMEASRIHFSLDHTWM